MLDFKEAIKEILEVEIASGKLVGFCDGVVLTSVEPLPTGYDAFVTLGSYRAGDVRVGKLQRKFREIEFDIECCGVVRKQGATPEADAEEAAYNLAKKVRTILKGKKTLVSATYPSGVAITSEPIDETALYLVYDGVPVAVNSILYYIKLVEAD